MDEITQKHLAVGHKILSQKEGLLVEKIANQIASLMEVLTILNPDAALDCAQQLTKQINTITMTDEKERLNKHYQKLFESLKI